MVRIAVDKTARGEAKWIGPQMIEADCPRCGKHIHLEIKRKPRPRTRGKAKV